MTRQRSFKRLVRARMEKTGESYTAARGRLLATEEPDGTKELALPTSDGAIRERTGLASQVVVERDGRQVTLSITPVENQVPVLDADGAAVVDPDGRLRTTTAGFVGVVPLRRLDPQPVTAVPGFVADAVVGTAGIVVRTWSSMIRGPLT